MEPVVKESGLSLRVAFLSALLEAALQDRTVYWPLFIDPRLGAVWIPQARYRTQFEDSSFRLLAVFEEDLDLTTTSLQGHAFPESGCLSGMSGD